MKIKGTHYSAWGLVALTLEEVASFWEHLAALAWRRCQR